MLAGSGPLWPTSWLLSVIRISIALKDLPLIPSIQLQCLTVVDLQSVVMHMLRTFPFGVMMLSDVTPGDHEP